MNVQEFNDIKKIKSDIESPMISIEDLPKNEKGELYSGTLLVGFKNSGVDTFNLHVYAKDGILHSVISSYEIERHVKGKSIKMEDCVPDRAYTETVNFTLAKLLINEGFDFSLSELKGHEKSLSFGEFCASEATVE